MTLNRPQNRIREILLAHGSTQKWLAATTELDPATISRIVSNPYARPSLAMAVRIARALGVAVEELLVESNEAVPA